MTVSLIIHRIKDAAYRYPFPKAQLTDLFDIFGIDLQFSDGNLLDKDPETLTGYEDVAKSFHGSIGDPGHLILGLTLAGDNYTNGLLLTRKRTCVAIFTDSSNILNATDPQAKLLEVCAHEIGHLLNRIHRDGVTQIPTIECEAFVLIGQDIAKAWDKRQLSQHRTFQTFPFSQASEQAFRTDDDASLLPWGESFRDGDPVDHGASRTGMTISIRPEPFRWKVGGVFGCIVAVRNQGMNRRKLVHNLDPTVGNVALEIVRPDGTRYIHRPHIYACGHRSLSLAIGQSVQQPLLLVDGPGYSVFPASGSYRVRAWLRSPRCHSRWISIRVGKVPRQSFDRSFAKFLVGGAYSDRSRHWQRVNALLAKPLAKDDSLIRYLALVKAKRQRDITEKVKWLKIAGSKYAARAVRHEAAFEAAYHARGKLGILHDCCKQIRRALRAKGIDLHLHEKLSMLKSANSSRR